MVVAVAVVVGVMVVVVVYFRMRVRTISDRRLYFTPIRTYSQSLLAAHTHERHQDKIDSCVSEVIRSKSNAYHG